MPRIAGVDLPNNKRMEIALTSVYGVGRASARRVLTLAGIDLDTRSQDLDETQVKKIRDIIEKEMMVEGDLKSHIQTNIKRLIEIKCYRGMRHVKGLPLRGQRTKTNARTRKGKIKTVANKKIAR